jgi:hypothetical protein
MQQNKWASTTSRKPHAATVSELPAEGEQEKRSNSKLESVGLTSIREKSSQRINHRSSLGSGKIHNPGESSAQHPLASPGAPLPEVSENSTKIHPN